MQMRAFLHHDSIDSQRKALALVEAKAATAPDDDAVQYLLVRARGRLADSMREGGRFNEAIEIYRAAFEKLKKDAPAGNSYFGFAEGVTEEKLGDVYAEQGKFAEAAAAYRKTLELWNRPEANQTDLSRSPERIDSAREKLSKIVN